MPNSFLLYPKMGVDIVDGQRVLIIDDNIISRVILTNIFNKEFEILEAENGKVGLELACRYCDSIAVILLDLVMPEMNGYEFLAEIKKRNMLNLIPVIVVSADDDSSIESNILDQGAADMIATPIVPNIVRRRVENVISANNYKHTMEALTKSLASEIRHSRSMIVETLCSIIEQRSLESGQHIKRIRMFTDIILRYMAENYSDVNLDESMIECISNASMLHDIGKIVIPDAILNKPSRLTADEFEVMKSHAVEGANIIRKLSFIREKNYLEYAWQIAMYHHERWDGKGYPEGLSGDAIPLCAQAVAIADVYDALTTHRVYKPVIPHQQAVVMILNDECGVFSDRMKQALRAVAPKFLELADMFRDGEISAEIDDGTKDSISDEVLDEAFRSDYYKYLTSLQMFDGFVIEVDYDTHAYKLVQPLKNPFSGLHVHGDFWIDARVFIDELVHPEDCVAVLKQFDEDRQSIESGHNTRSSCTARMRLSRGGEYRKYQFTQLRIDMQSVSQHKSLIFIRDVESLENGDNLAGGEHSALMQPQQFSAVPETLQSVLANFREIGATTDMFYEVFRRSYDILAVININTGKIAYDGRSDLSRFPAIPKTIQKVAEWAKNALHPDDVLSFSTMLEKIVMGTLEGKITFRVLTKAGNCESFVGRAFPVRNDDNTTHIAAALSVRRQNIK